MRFPMKVFAKVWKPVLSIGLFTAALLFLQHELRHYQYQQLVRDLHLLPASSIWLALGLCALNYLVLTAYDALSLRYVKRRVAYPKIALASFIGYAFSYNLGFPLVTGSAVRFRFLSHWGLSAVEITKVIAFNGISFWLGFWLLGGVFMVIEPLELTALGGLSKGAVRALGTAVLAAGVAYVVSIALRRRPIYVRGIELPMPSLRLATAALLVAWLDWILAGTVLYVLLPKQAAVSYPMFMDIFFMAQVVGLVSHVPGGLGVFETVLLSLFPGEVAAPAVLASLLAYRVIYYVLPFFLSLLLFGGHEVLVNRVQVKGLMRQIGDWAEPLSARLLAYAVFIGGLLLLFSGALPAVPARVRYLEQLVPLPLSELAHVLASACGALLLVLAWALRRRVVTAYRGAVTLLAAGALLSLLKGGDYEEALLLLVILGVLASAKRRFFRSASLLGGRLTPSWGAAIAVGVAASIWIGLFAYKRVPYSDSLWRQIGPGGDAARFLRGSVAAIAVVALFMLLKLWRWRRSAAPPPTRDELAAAERLVRESARTYAELALLDDKHLLFNQERTAFVMYGDTGQARVVVGDPIGAEDAFHTLLWDFRELCEVHSVLPAFYALSPRYLGCYIDLGMSILKIGAEARVPLHRELPAAAADAACPGFCVKVLSVVETAQHLSGLKRVSDAWRASTHAREASFVLGRFDETYVKRFRTAVVLCGAEIVAFGSLWEGAAKEELAVDVLRCAPEAPAGSLSLLFVEVMRWGAAEGFGWFNLGTVPDLENGELQPLWDNMGPALFRHGEHFADFTALQRFKQQFDPVWEARYLACPSGFVAAPILHQIGELISGTIRRKA